MHAHSWGEEKETILKNRIQISVIHVNSYLNHASVPGRESSEQNFE